MQAACIQAAGYATLVSHYFRCDALLGAGQECALTPLSNKRTDYCQKRFIK